MEDLGQDLDQSLDHDLEHSMIHNQERKDHDHYLEQEKSYEEGRTVIRT